MQADRPSKNYILKSLPSLERAQLGRLLEPVEFTRGCVLQEAGEPVNRLIFPETCVVSLVQAFSDGETVETATIGCEGLICVLTVISGHSRSMLRCVVQISGAGWAVDRGAFVKLLNLLPGLKTAVLQFSMDLLGQAFLSVACNRVHVAEQRLARWLLMTHDRSSLGNMLPLTHDILAEMLGVHRPTVSIAAQALERAGLIRYSRGEVTIVDRIGLERAACECYGISRRHLPVSC